jgi:ketol-acid reductoisomerase
LDWWKKFRDATLPVFTELYDSVASGKEAALSIESNSKPDYREKLEEELKELRESELWQAGKAVRSLRPENQPPEPPTPKGELQNEPYELQTIEL